MNQLSIENIIYSKFPTFMKAWPKLARDVLFSIIKKIIHQNEINDFIKKHHTKSGLSLIDEIFDYIDFSYSVSQKDRDKIPSEGRLICIANHPLGGLDGLILLKMIKEIRSDVKIVVNDLLLHIENLSELFLPYDINKPGMQKDKIMAIGNSLKNEEAIIFFPAGEVSRLKINGIRDSKWNKGAIYFAKKYNAPVLPIYLEAKNSFIFYLVSIINKKLSMFLLPHELFNKKSKTVTIKIGSPISSKIFSANIHPAKLLIKLLRKHLFRIAKNKKGLFITEKNVIHPVDRKLLKKQILNSEPLGLTEDGKKIVLTSYNESPDVIKEIARLREVTFRKVGEGTGNKLDRDKYDSLYEHLVLWDDKELEIVGAYRIAVCKNIIIQAGEKGLYTSTLFDFSNEMGKIFPQAIELGRSFVQAKYWNTLALDYLWQGLGAFLLKHPEIKFLLGAVSISNSYPEEAKDMIVYFYKKWFSSNLKFVSAKNKYTISNRNYKNIENIFSSGDYNTELKILKTRLRLYGLSIPTLYKQYSELCEPGGTQFIEFGIDRDFQNCIDAFIIVDVDMIKENKKKRYINKHYVENELQLASTL